MQPATVPNLLERNTLRTAAKRCPDCVFLPVDADAYNEVSARDVLDYVASIYARGDAK